MDNIDFIVLYVVKDLRAGRTQDALKYIPKVMTGTRLPEHTQEDVIGLVEVANLDDAEDLGIRYVDVFALMDKYGTTIWTEGGNHEEN